jgi:aminomethyltransferase
VSDLIPDPVLNIEPENPDELHIVPLDRLHRALGAKMVPFAGYDMPVQYGTARRT